MAQTVRRPADDQQHAAGDGPRGGCRAGRRRPGGGQPDLQPGETTASLNLNWYAPQGTADAKVKFGDVTVDAAESELTTPTKVDESKYTDTGKIVCKATVTGLEPGKTYEYQISNDGGSTWSKTYTYTAPQADSFTFAFTSDPQIKDGGETNGEGWNPADGTNQTGWAKMMEEVAQAGATLMVSAGDQVEDQSWGKSSEYAAFFAPEEMTSIAYAPAVATTTATICSPTTSTCPTRWTWRRMASPAMRTPWSR